MAFLLFDKGTGLGLYFVSRPFDFAQGKIAYRGGNGQGAKFGEGEIGFELGSFWVRFGFVFSRGLGWFVLVNLCATEGCIGFVL